MLLVGQRYYFGYGDGGWDTAFFNQILCNLSHGAGFYCSLDGANFLSDHCHYYAFLLASLYWIWPDSMVLRYFQIGVLFVGAYIFFLILKKRLHPFIALGGMIVFTLSPANIAMMRGCFNFEPVAIPLVLLVFKAFDDQKYNLFLVSCFFLALVKEQMPLVVMMFGVLALFVRKEDKIKWALVPLLMGLAIFVFDEFVLTPYVRRDLPVTQSLQWAFYGHYGNTPANICLYLLTHPGKIYAQIVSPDIVKWYNDLFGVWGALAFLSPQVLLPALPLFLKSILRDFKLEHNVTGVYYAATFTPYIYLAAWNTLNQFQNKNRLLIHSLALALMLGHALTFMPLWTTMLKMPITTKAVIMQRFLDKMPPQASLVGLTDDALYWLHNYEMGKYNSGKIFVLPQNVDYLIMDLSDAGHKKYISQLMANEAFYRRWRLEESIEDLGLYVKNTSQENQVKLVDISKRPFLEKNSSVNFDDAISFQGIDFPDQFPQKYRIFPVTMYWQGLKGGKDIYDVSFEVFLKNKRLFSKTIPIGSTIYQTDHWQAGEYIKEHYFYFLPHLVPGVYLVEVKIIQKGIVPKGPVPLQSKGGFPKTRILGQSPYECVSRNFVVDR